MIVIYVAGLFVGCATDDLCEYHGVHLLKLKSVHEKKMFLKCFTN